MYLPNPPLTHVYIQDRRDAVPLANQKNRNGTRHGVSSSTANSGMGPIPLRNTTDPSQGTSGLGSSIAKEEMRLDI
jgi:hypothetical protein